MITADMIVDVMETRHCSCLAEAALDARVPFDAIVMHTGSLLIHSGDVLRVMRVIETTALCRVLGALVAIHIKRLKPSEVTTL